MNKMQLYILDDDTEYADRLAAFIRCSEFADRWQVKLFSKPEFILDVMESQQLDGVLLMSETYYPIMIHRNTSLCKMVLSETIANSSDVETKVPFLYRFQSLQQMLSRLQAFYAEMSQTCVGALTNRTKVLSFYSSSGSSGKSITALHLAKQLSLRGERVFYLSLESISAASLWLNGDSGGFSQLLYYLKSTPDSLAPKLQLYKSHDARLRFDYLIANDQIREMYEMSGEHAKLLVEALIALDAYDFILIDLESSIYPRILKSLELSDYILWLVRDDLNDFFKTKALYKQLGLKSNVHFVMNKYTGSQMNDLQALDKKLTCKLPYIPEWKSLSSPEQVWQSAIFSGQVYEMFLVILGRSYSQSASHLEGAAAS
ncbi:hypothetical protein [Paenibacillus marchantiophytorum]|uniref:hypothetical protein n=1 Tax=Paenibacillus marchantiophytorum TaxID=1619310 RepID=UPI00166AF32E|nr:hypothetical protein [Paenibacillus marchantiophytorum]